MLDRSSCSLSQALTLPAFYMFTIRTLPGIFFPDKTYLTYLPDLPAFFDLIYQQDPLILRIQDPESWKFENSNF